MILCKFAPSTSYVRTYVIILYIAGARVFFFGAYFRLRVLPAIVIRMRGHASLALAGDSRGRLQL